DQERAMGFIPGSDHIPMGQIPDAADPQNPDRNPLLESDDHLVVYCAAGARSAKVVQFLMAGGRQRISNLAGGIQGWAQAGGAITR
ncbi:MAG: rhodanese-like domain-containing protein, partial [Pseudomonadota bacterium]